MPTTNNLFQAVVQNPFVMQAPGYTGKFTISFGYGAYQGFSLYDSAQSFTNFAIDTTNSQALVNSVGDVIVTGNSSVQLSSGGNVYLGEPAFGFFANPNQTPATFNSVSSGQIMFDGNHNYFDGAGLKFIGGDHKLYDAGGLMAIDLTTPNQVNLASSLICNNASTIINNICFLKGQARLMGTVWADNGVTQALANQTVTTASLTGKTMTFKNGLLVGFA